MLDITGITAGYGNVPILKDLSTSFAKGKLTALVGPNGCGKSTLLKAVMGFLPVSTGEITFDGRSTSDIGRRELARQIAYLPQENRCPDYMTLGELVELAGYARQSLAGGPSERDRRLFREALEIVGLADLAGHSVNALSGGQRQRAWIAMVLAQDTDVILMDEPVNHLDIKYQYTVLALVRELSVRHGKTVVTVLHDLNLASSFADDVIMLRAGKVIAEGAVDRTITARNVEAVFDLPVDVFHRDGRIICMPRMPNAQSVAA